VYLFHGRGEAPGNPLTLEEMLWARFPRVNYIRPLLRHIDPTVTAKDSFKSASHKTFMIEPKSLIIGFGMGGLIAAALQERFPLHELSVFAISSPTHMTTLTLTKRIEDRRVAVYSHLDKVTESATAGWPDLTNQAYDVSWMMSATHRKYSVAAVVSAFMVNEYIALAVKNVFGDDDAD
jgi:esterase/lipase